LHADPIGTLTKKAERLFIYAHTVMEYLNHKIQEISKQRLDAVLRDGAGKMGMPALDALYTTVLQNAYDQEAIENDDVRARVTALLAGLVALQTSYYNNYDLTVKLLAPLMNLDEDAVIRTVEELRSILSITGEDLRTAVIRPLHLTFSEFLVDNKGWTRSSFDIDRDACHLRFAKACLRTLNTQLRRDTCGLENAYTRRYGITGYEYIHVKYACEHWHEHLCLKEPTGDPFLWQLFEGFCQKTILQWVEFDSLFKKSNVTYVLGDVQIWAEVSVYLCHGSASPEVRLIYVRNTWIPRMFQPSYSMFADSIGCAAH
jgi:hypothetical protein